MHKGSIPHKTKFCFNQLKYNEVHYALSSSCNMGLLMFQERGKICGERINTTIKETVNTIIVCKLIV
jgi:hypothetical protein